MTFQDCLKLGVDYMDMMTGDIYCIQEYDRIKKLGLPNIHGGIRVVDPVGNYIGVVSDTTLNNFEDKK